MSELVFISHHENDTQSVSELKQAMLAKGLAIASNAAAASTIILFISMGYIDPRSPTIATARAFLDQQKKLVIAVFAGISISQVKHLVESPGWDEHGTLKLLTSWCGIDVKNLTSETVAGKLKAAIVNRGSSSMSYDIFLSHAGEDKEDFVEELWRVLKQQHRCFFDKESMLPGHLGRTGEEQLIDAVENSRLALFVLSDRSIKKKWPVKELNIFMKSNKPIVVVWCRLLEEQAKQYMCNPPPDLLEHDGAVYFLKCIFNQYRPYVMSIPYKPTHAYPWNKPDFHSYAVHIKSEIEKNYNLGRS